MSPKLLAIVFAFSAVGYQLAGQSFVYLVLQKGASSIAYYSSDGKLLGTIPTGKHPHEMVFSPDRRFLYTTDNGSMRIEHAGSGGNSLSVIDVVERRKYADINLGEYRRPHGIDVDPATGRIVVTTELPDQLLVIDPEKRSVLKHFATRGNTSHMVTLGPGGRFAYVSNSGSSNVSAIDLNSGEVKLIPTGNRPEGSVLSKDGRELYVCNREAASITVIDTTRQSAIANIPTGKGPVRIALTPDGKTLVYALMHDKKIAFADPRARKQTDYLILPNEPISLKLTPDGTQALASAEEADMVYVISIEKKRILQAIQMEKGAGPDVVLAMP